LKAEEETNALSSFLPFRPVGLVFITPGMLSAISGHAAGGVGGSFGAVLACCADARFAFLLYVCKFSLLTWSARKVFFSTSPPFTNFIAPSNFTESSNFAGQTTGRIMEIPEEDREDSDFDLWADPHRPPNVTRAKQIERAFGESGHIAMLK
jgi:hypothetical protein